MGSLRLLCLIPLCLLFTSPVLAEDEEKDTRLDQKVTLSIGSVTMDQFAAELTKLTGIQITAGSSKSDWQVKERRTIIYVKDISAGDLMQRVAKLHHYRLSKSGPEGKWTYNYRQDRRFREEESKLRDDLIDSQYRNAARSLNYMADLSGVKASPSELEQLAEKEPYMAFLLKDPLGQAMCDVAARLPADFMNKDGKWSMSLSKADPGLQEAATRFMREMKKLEAKWSVAQGGDAVEDDSFDMPVKEISFAGFEATAQMPEEYKLGVLGELDVSYGTSEDVDFPMLDPDGAIAKIICKAATATRAGEDLQALQQEVKEIANSKTDNYPLKADPILNEKIKFEKPSDYPLTFKCIHEKTGLQVISDSYRENWIMEGEQTIKQVVVLAREGFQKEILKQGKWLVAQDQMWFFKRLSDIPEAYIQDLKDKLKERDLVYADFLRIARDLTKNQIEDNLVSQPGLEGLDSLRWKQTREGLFFLSSLTPNQLKSMTGKSCLPAEDLPEDVLQHGLAAAGWTSADVEDKGVAFTGYEPSMDESKKLQTGAQFTINLTQEDGSVSPNGCVLSTHARRTRPDKKAS